MRPEFQGGKSLSFIFLSLDGGTDSTKDADFSLRGICPVKKPFQSAHHHIRVIGAKKAKLI